MYYLLCIKHQPKPQKIHVPLMHFTEIRLFANLPLRGIETEKSAQLKGGEFHQIVAFFILEDALSLWYTKYDQKSNIFNRGHIYLSETAGCAKSKPNSVTIQMKLYFRYFRVVLFILQRSRSKKNYGFSDFLFFVIFYRQALFSVKAQKEIMCYTELLQLSHQS